MTAVTTQKSYSNDWRRTNPDLVVFLPPVPPYYPEAADHVLVDYTPGGDLLAIWTMGLEPNRRDFNVVYARSMDGGVNWTSPTPIHEPGALGHTSQFGWPVISKTGRIYCFYNRTVGIGLPGVANIRCRYSDDDGYTWVDGGVEIPYRRTKWDHPDPDVPAACITWQKPVRDAQGRQIVPLTRTTHPYLKQDLRAMDMGDRPDVGLGECRSEFLRFDNIDEGPDPKDLKLTWLPDDEDLISVLVSFEPHRSKGYSFCQEPGLVLLPDGRLFTAMRTANGQVWYTVSDDDGHSWRETEICGSRTAAIRCSTRSRRLRSSVWRMAATSCSTRTTTASATVGRARSTSTAEGRSSYRWESSGKERISPSGSASLCSLPTRRR